jgi:hypothetical protein
VYAGIDPRTERPGGTSRKGQHRRLRAAFNRTKTLAVEWISPKPDAPTTAAILARKKPGSAPGRNGAGDLSGEIGVGQQLVDQCREDLLSGDAGDAELVGGLLLPEVEGSVGGEREVDGPSGSLVAHSLNRHLPKGGDALGRPGLAGTGWPGGRRVGAKPSGTGFVAAWEATHRGDLL